MGYWKDTLAKIAAVKTTVDTLSLISDKEKSLLGIGVLEGWQEYFNKVANDANPEVASWSVVETGGTANVENDTAGAPGYQHCSTGITTGNDSIAYTRGKKTFGLKYGVTTIHLEARVKVGFTADNGDKWGIGFVENDLTPTQVNSIVQPNANPALISMTSAVISATTSDNTTIEQTDITAFITNDTWFNLLIIISATDVKFYIDGTLRATHETNVPASVWQVVLAATCQNSAAQHTYCQYVRVWGE